MLSFFVRGGQIMPTQVFFNLPCEKQMKIVGAALLELSRVPADSISINKIIQYADISRGSFYQYFEDKDDLIGYILSDFKARLQRGLKSGLEKSGGDIFKMAEAAYCDIINIAKNEENRKIIGNFFLGMKFTKRGRKSFWELFDTGENTIRSIISANIDKSNLRCSEPYFMDNVFEMMFLVMVQSITDTFSDYKNAESYKNDLFTRLDIIRRGVAL